MCLILHDSSVCVGVLGLLKIDGEYRKEGLSVAL